jgi:hypothetical protein
MAPDFRNHVAQRGGIFAVVPISIRRVAEGKPNHYNDKKSSQSTSPNNTIGLDEANANPRRLPPDYLAVALEVIHLDDKEELVGDTDHAGDFKHCPQLRNVLNDARNAATLVERDCAGLKGALAGRRCTTFEHGLNTGRSANQLRHTSIA